ncbi:MAG: adenine deaminase, partial [Chthoniobacterales bacterium]
RISAIRRLESAPDRFLIPGFVDAHVHVESSMLPPTEFARLAVRHGTVATVSDPHEIANVLGVEGVNFMIDNARHTPFKFCFGAPSCVPATDFETAGARLDVNAVADLLARPEIGYLSEVMNWPGVLAGDADMLGKIAVAKALGKPVDGHAPGLRGADAAKYAAAGIETDHECYTLDEALDKIAAGMLIAIREGSAARNFAALEPLLKSHPDRCMLCCDDIHPDSLVVGHIEKLVARAVTGGADVFDVLWAACAKPVEHYHLSVGLLRVGDAADFAVVENLTNFRVLETWIAGQCVARDGVSLLPSVEVTPLNRFGASVIDVSQLRVPATTGAVHVIEALDGQLITGHLELEMVAEGGFVPADPERDILKIAVVNRYADAPPAVGFIRGFGLRHGAIASSVAHDSHNVVAVGASDECLCRAINHVIASRGGVCATDGSDDRLLPLEIAGLMSVLDGDVVAERYAEVADFARSLGSPLRDAFMTLSFMALLVIPDLKMSDRGLFSGKRFEFVK